MKTIPELKAEVKDIEYKIHHEEMKPAAQKRLRKRIPFLKTCIMYLEEKPDHQYMRSEIQKIETKITLRMNQFVLDDYKEVDKQTVNKLKKAHEKKYEIPHLREQVRTLRFLLK